MFYRKIVSDLINVNNLKTFGSSAKVYFDKQDFIFQGLDFYSDLIIRGKLKKKLFEKPTSITFKKNNEIKETNNIKQEIDRIDKLTYVDLITTFNLNAFLIKKIRSVIQRNKSTHMRFFTFNNDVRLTLFDFRSFISQAQFLKRNSIKLFSLPSVQYVKEVFSKTLRTDSFLKTSQNELEIEITKSHIVILKDNRKQLSFLLADQNLKEPIVSFNCEKINKSVSFLFSKGLYVRNTEINV